MIVRPLTRRSFLRGALSVAALLRVPMADATTRPLIPRAVLFGNPDITSVRLSYDGTMLAYIAPREGVRNLWVAPLDDLQAARPVTREQGRGISSFFQWAFTHRHVVFFQDHDGDENWRASSVDIASGTIVPLTPARSVRAYRQEVSPHFPSAMLFSHNQRDKRYHDIYRIDVVTGAAELLYENTKFTALLTDSTFALRLGAQVLPNGDSAWLERHADGSWQVLLTVPIGDVDTTRLLGFNAEGTTLYLLDSRGRDKAALVAFDMARHTTQVLAEDAEADLTDVLFSNDTRVPLAAGGMVERQRWQALDPALAETLAVVTRASLGDVYFSSQNFDGSKTIVYVERDTASAAFALWERGTSQLRPLYKERASLDKVTLRPLEPVAFAARDGLPLHGYLTLPVAGATRVPLVLVIHGGPYARDRWGFTATHQWLANRGYAVLSVNYRGSTGFGKAFVTAADREWGGKMHDDLLDAVRWAVARGIADEARVGFYGASYGGYAALTAATRTPEVFACIVDVFGIANLLTFMTAIPPYWQAWFAVWKNRLGDPDTEAGRAWLRERSPLTHVDRAVRPILIAQGLQDVRVTRLESEQMVAGLKARRVPVTYITFADEGHGFIQPANQIAFRAVTEAFLATHLGGAFEPIDATRDFHGSSLVVEAGAELVPGLAGVR